MKGHELRYLKKDPCSSVKQGLINSWMHAKSTNKEPSWSSNHRYSKQIQRMHLNKSCSHHRHTQRFKQKEILFRASVRYKNETIITYFKNDLALKDALGAWDNFKMFHCLAVCWQCKTYVQSGKILKVILCFKICKV